MQEDMEKEMEKNGLDASGRSGGRSRSESVDPTKSERRRSTSTSASKANRRDSHRNNRSQSQSRPRMSDVLAASTQRLDASGRGRTSSRDLEGGGIRRGSSSMHRSSPPPPTTTPAAAPHSSSRRSSSYHGRALEFTQKVMESTTPGATPHSTPGNNALTTTNHQPSSAPTPYNTTPGAMIQHGTRPPLPTLPIDEEEEDFDESDPVIMIPIIIDHSHNNMPPPPPRTLEETERHQERLETRRNNIRRDREERQKRRGSGTIAKKNKKSDKKVTPTEIRERKSLGENTKGRSARLDQHRSFAPSPAALAMLLEGGANVPEDPPQNKRERKHRDKKYNGGDAHPSPTALALLEGNLKSSERRASKRHSHAAPPRRTSKKDQIEKLSRMHHRDRSKGNNDGDDSVISETSSLSYASAKMYRNQNEHTRHHPELEGVNLPEPPETSFPSHVTLDRSTSLSRSKSQSRRSREDPPTTPKERKRGVSKSASRRVSSSAGQALAGKESRRESSRGRRAALAARKTPTTSDHAEEKEKKHEKRVSLKETSMPSSRQRSSSRRAAQPRPSRHEEEFSKLAPGLAASSARSARRSNGSNGGGGGVSARSNTSKNRHWDVSGNAVDSVHNHRSASRPKERSSSRVTSSAARSSSPTKSRTGRGGARSENGKKQRSKSVSSRRVSSKSTDLWKHHSNTNVAHQSTSGNSKGNRSRVTSSTHPESLSSAEFARLTFSEEKEAIATHHEIREEEEVEPMVIYKKRAHRSHQKEEVHIANDATSQYTKPMTLIACSSDEKSHASSISSSSTIEESFASDDDDDDGDGKKSAKKKALSALQGAKGGAKNFATKGKSALKLGGLKGTSRKWQSALFM